MTDRSREAILSRVRQAVGNGARSALHAPAAGIPPRAAGVADADLDLLLSEIAKLGGQVLRLEGREDLAGALSQLVAAETVRKAVLWQTDDLDSLGIGEALAALGVALVAPDADKRAVAECDLGVTGVDAALPETGTLVLRASPGKRQLVSLLPRVHLAIVRPGALRADLHQVVDEVKGDRRVHCITGPSRTADIEKTLAIGVHGPKRLYVWALP
ncbi:MAG: lactate utilization protein [Chloroflexi bacterium]|nr:lactate utilization protein [Chloroflexota bacterium]